MARFNQCSFIGRLGKDPELAVTGNGKPFTKFSLAVDQGNDETMWLNVTTWDKLAEMVDKYARKGLQVFVQGQLRIRSYDDKQGVKRQFVDIIANTVQILDKKANGETPPTAADNDKDPFAPDDF